MLRDNAVSDGPDLHDLLEPLVAGFTADDWKCEGRFRALLESILALISVSLSIGVKIKVVSPLFALPEYDIAARSFMSKTINDLMRRTDSVLNQIPFHKVAELPKSQVTVQSGDVVKTDEIVCEINFSVSLSDAVQGSFEGFSTSMSMAAESGLQSLMPQIFNSISQVCLATGSTVTAGPEGFTHEVFMQMLEGLSIHFDDEGKHNLSWVMSPEMFEKLGKLPRPTPEQNQAVERLLDRKRREFFNNKRLRQLTQRADQSSSDGNKSQT